MFASADENVDLVIIDVENTEIPCNKKKLCVSSDYFNAMFNGNFIESNQKSVVIQGLNVTVFRNILKYIDDKDFCVENEDLLEILEGARMLQIDDIQDHCIRRLTDNLSVNTCLPVWRTCEQLNIQPLATKAKCIALIEFNAIKETNHVSLLNVEELHSYLASTLLYCDNEIDVFETGMKWYYEHSKNGAQNLQNGDLSHENKCLLTVLNCLDFNNISKDDVTMMKFYPDIANNLFITDVLNYFLAFLHDNSIDLPENINKYVKVLFKNRKKRERKVLPCIASRDILYNIDISKRLKKCDTAKNSNIYFYDGNQKVMQKFINTHFHDDNKCNDLLEGYHMLAYKENILFFGGQYKYGASDWNRNIWMYNTIKEKWKIITKMPKERRHFKSTIINGKLFIIGGTGKFRIIQDDMFYYDFAKDQWSANIALPDPLFDAKCCEFRNQLFVMSGSFRNKFGFFYNLATRIWQRVDIKDKNNLIPQTFDTFIMFSHNNRLFIKGNYLIELDFNQTALEVKNCEETKPLDSDECAFFKADKYLYIFSKIDAYCDNAGYCALSRYSINEKSTDLLIIYEQTYDHTWMLNAGCFGLFHYSIVAKSDCISTCIK